MTTTTDNNNNNNKQTTRHSNSFESLEILSPGVLKYIHSKKFLEMTPVQAATIPLLLKNKDVIVQAVTGSGKTLSFLIPLVERLKDKKLKRREIGALIVSPTRELARQTYEILAELCEFVRMPKPLLLVGGNSSNSSSSSRPISQDAAMFERHNCDILVGTPGRVLDFTTRFTWDFSEFDCLILDEADVLLLHNNADTLQLLTKLPRMRRTGLFSATNDASLLKELVKQAGMRNPVRINVAVNKEEQNEEQATPTSLTNYYMVTTLQDKLSCLVSFLQEHSENKIMVFFLTCASVDFYGTALQQYFQKHQKVILHCLHGKMVQKRREKTMQTFRECSNATLFCTDVAARGLDVTNVEWVVQFDAPSQDPAVFVHRVGRCARAGNVGRSLLFLTPKEESYIDLLQNRNVPLQEYCDENDQEDNDAVPDDSLSATFFKYKHCNETILNEIREMVKQDRDLLEKGTKAFTSYIRAYKEHRCAFIFRFASLDLGHLANLFCLLKLPKMPELRNAKGLDHFVPEESVEFAAIPYKDNKPRETARQKRLLEQEQENKKKKPPTPKNNKNKPPQGESQQNQHNKKRKKKGRNVKIMEEWEDLAKEERNYKKFKRGKISKEQYEDMLLYNREHKDDKNDDASADSE